MAHSFVAKYRLRAKSDVPEIFQRRNRDELSACIRHRADTAAQLTGSGWPARVRITNQEIADSCSRLRFESSSAILDRMYDPQQLGTDQILANRKLFYSDEWIFERTTCHIWWIGASIVNRERKN
ncbi:uncharacterized protein LOC105253774 [Camponotus floridanus]|uniref:uncharacterized protein LOC105253774 n=1 Tax=Camponotus floridanus TaxID=104421 RepID=UPI00059EC4A7|nr:uncharacterized protein LOC105253774 [Camponotus floridanus]